MAYSSNSWKGAFVITYYVFSKIGSRLELHA